MKNILRFGIPLLAICCAAPAMAEDDAEGCKDHPAFTRMPGYRINSCEIKDFDAREFPSSAALNGENKAAKPVTIEGKQTYIVYDMPGEVKHASGLQIQRNYLNAGKAAGAVVIGEFGAEGSGKQFNDDTWGTGDRALVLKFTKGGKETWLRLHPYNGGGGYALYIAEREAMKQDVVVNEMVDKINKEGFISLYINFDTGKASIKPDSYSQLDQVVSALNATPALKLEVGGHTDNVGNADANKTLSEGRAKAVMKYLTDKGIAAARLSATGYGQTSPVADNRTDDGRAKNRRVDLVKK